ncbi:N-succinylarginine dihydrolase [Mycetohabitans sp. B4]|nr:N-succinylarginine dihydrolase [Mycetohabitans sp. B4]
MEERQVVCATERGVERHYRDRLNADDLGDPQLLAQCCTVLNELTQ